MDPLHDKRYRRHKKVTPSLFPQEPISHTVEINDKTLERCDLQTSKFDGSFNDALLQATREIHEANPTFDEHEFMALFYSQCMNRYIPHIVIVESPIKRLSNIALTQILTVWITAVVNFSQMHRLAHETTWKLISSFLATWAQDEDSPLFPVHKSLRASNVFSGRDDMAEIVRQTLESLGPLPEGIELTEGMLSLDWNNLTVDLIQKLMTHGEKFKPLLKKMERYMEKSSKKAHKQREVSSDMSRCALYQTPVYFSKESMRDTYANALSYLNPLYIPLMTYYIGEAKRFPKDVHMLPEISLNTYIEISNVTMPFLEIMKVQGIPTKVY